MRIDVEALGYDSAAEALVGANRDAAIAYDNLRAKLGGYDALGGDDTTSEDFVREYDGAAAEAVDALAALVEGLGALGEITRASALNHRRANAGSVYGRGAAYSGGDPGATPVTVSAFTPPSSLGGDNTDVPDWWNHVVDHLQGWGWPSANTDQLRDASTAWRAAAGAIDALAGSLDVAAGYLEQQRSPEIDTATRIISRTRGNITELADCLAGLGDACQDYASQVDETREAIKDLLKDLAIECGVTAGASFALSFVTFGGAAAAGAAVITARAIRYAHRILEALKVLRAARAVLAVAKSAPRLNKVRKAFEDLKTARKLTRLKSIGAPKMTSTLRQLEGKYKHAEALGVDLPRGRKGFKAFEKAVDDFLGSPATKTRPGEYRGQPCTLSFDTATGRCVILRPDGSFWSSWKLNFTQLEHVVRTGKLGGN